MDSKTEGAWVIHHSRKLLSVVTGAYNNIDFAGKCGILLNALAATHETDVEKNHVETLARAAHINPKTELSSLLDELHRQRLIDVGQNGIGILGITTRESLDHTATIFKEAEPSALENATIEISEKSSEIPLLYNEAVEYVSDQYQIPTSDTKDFLRHAKDVGFIDIEGTGSEAILFNGNLFRGENPKKVSNVLSSLDDNEAFKTHLLLQTLQEKGIIPYDRAVSIAGDQLLNKLISVGFIDVNKLGNEKGTFSFITHPSAFNKFGNATVDDAFDLAKALVTSLAYGMTQSASGRGRILDIKKLLGALLDGRWIGTSTAIGQDYKVLEMKGVVKVKPHDNGRYSMKLLKQDVGEIALQVITEGEASTTSISTIHGVKANSYLGPEVNRSVIRKNQPDEAKLNLVEIVTNLRTGTI